ncbi:hypothetical protein GCM10008083_04670 [Ulvibacter litoralis]|nr:hypothetical protein GCM10008083_04670 [Ulvibacter litoralis]
MMVFFNGKAQQENSLLWKVEGNGIKTSYVFGTFHMLPKEDFQLKQKVKNAIESSETIVLELDMDDPNLQSEMMKESVLSEGNSLKNFMDEQEYARLDAYFNEKMGVGMDKFVSFKPMVLSSMVMMTYLGKGFASYEGTLIEMAAAQQKEVKGLETVAFQMGMFDKQPYEDQIDDVVKLLVEDAFMKDMFAEMIALYKAEDIQNLYAYMDEYFDGDVELMERLLHERNANWIPKIGALSKEEAVFYGVGAGHLGGDKGVINLLKKEGYTVTPILE